MNDVGLLVCLPACLLTWLPSTDGLPQSGAVFLGWLFLSRPPSLPPTRILTSGLNLVGLVRTFLFSLSHFARLGRPFLPWPKSRAIATAFLTWKLRFALLPSCSFGRSVGRVPVETSLLEGGDIPLPRRCYFTQRPERGFVFRCLCFSR